MRIFLSGPMTGLPDFNYPLFNSTAESLRSYGHTVLNPAENCNGRQDMEHSEYLKHSLNQVLYADAIALLPGWEESEGANLELSVARGINLKTYEVEFPGGYLVPFAPDAIEESPPLCQWHGTLMVKGAWGNWQCHDLGDTFLTSGANTNETPVPTDILDEARAIVRGPREDDYGDKQTNMQRIADLWNGYLGYQEANISSFDVSQMMILVKVARNRHKPGRDSNVDIAGYTLIAQELMQ